MLSIRISPSPSLSEWQASLGATEKQLKTAAVRALNKTARWMRTTLARETAQELKIKVGLVREGMVIIRARSSQPETVVALKKSAGVIKAIRLGSATQTSTGVRVGRRQWGKAFIATMPSGHRGVFQRKGKPRLPIREIQLVITGRLARAMEDLAEGPALRQFEILFERELRYLIRTT